ncbi:reverse transcriptase [Gossypium australe]|uniref:Reverse transcriptase n=1 Tax=Gossypium australe TaxID=47621 RepID=A0A5B6W713_9ROSI|nr:reverse transcriptase [Gossypium australe]
MNWKKILGRFWWQKQHNKWGIHWCEWRKLSELKEDGGMGFRCLSKFNIAFLAKSARGLLEKGYVGVWDRVPKYQFGSMRGYQVLWTISYKH